MLLIAAPVDAQTWEAVDALRNKLTPHCVRVIQHHYSTHGLQRAYHPKNDTLIVCSTHRNAAKVWSALVQKATHRMQRCSCGSITLP